MHKARRVPRDAARAARASRGRPRDAAAEGGDARARCTTTDENNDGAADALRCHAMRRARPVFTRRPPAEAEHVHLDGSAEYDRRSAVRAFASRVGHELDTLWEGDVLEQRPRAAPGAATLAKAPPPPTAARARGNDGTAGAERREHDSPPRAHARACLGRREPQRERAQRALARAWWRGGRRGNQPGGTPEGARRRHAARFAAQRPRRSTARTGSSW